MDTTNYALRRFAATALLLTLHPLAVANPVFSLVVTTQAELPAGFAEGNCGEGMCGVAKMDTDRNGSVSRQEYEAFGARNFDAVDTNHDGSLADAELIKAGHGVEDKPASESRGK